MMLQGKRRIKADELETIIQYLGESPTPSATAPTAGSVRMGGRIGSAWYEAGQLPHSSLKVAPCLEYPPDRQIAYEVEQSVLGLPVGAVVLATEVERGQKPAVDQIAVVRREKSGFENLTLVRVTADPMPGVVVGIAIEARWPL
jgi:hypothetical protein